MSKPTETPARLYRGLSRSGIGEGPGTDSIFGEQYLPGNSALESDADLLQAVRAWMTLDWTGSDFAALQDEFEAWSCFVYRDLSFVVRLCGAGLFDRRLAFFSHAWAWPLSEFVNGFDPGVYLGNPDGFDAPWRDRPAPPVRRPLPPPSPVRPSQVLSAPVLSGSLLAHLYHSLASGTKSPVVLAVNTTDFRSRGFLPAIVSFVRAAIPLHLKRNCSIRIFTRNPAFFLNQLNANLLVIPEDQLSAAFGACRDAILLDRKGSRIEGRSPSDAALRYAEWMLTCFSKPELQNSLPACAERASRSLFSVTSPTLEQVAALPTIYRMAWASGDSAKTSELIADFMSKAAAPSVSWEKLIFPEDWAKVSNEILIQLMLHLGELTSSQKELQKLGSQEASRRGVDPAFEQAAVFLRQTAERYQQAGGAWKAQLAMRLSVLSLSEPQTRKLLHEHAISLLDIVELDEHEASRLLRAFGAQAFVGSESIAACAQLARYRSCLPYLIEKTTSGVIGNDWALPIVESWEIGDVLGFVQRIADAANSSRIWFPVLNRFITRILESVKLPPDQLEVIAQLFRAVASYGKDVEGARLVLELSARTNRPDWLRDAEVIAREERNTVLSAQRQRFLVERALRSSQDANRWLTLDVGYVVDRRSGKYDGKLLAPESWWPNVGDLLWTDAVRTELSAIELGKLWRAVGQERTAEFVAELDERICASPWRISELIEMDVWHVWRSHSRLDGRQDLKSAAVNWCAYFPRNKQPLLEDWKRIVEDLGTIEAEDLRNMLERNDFPFPWIPWFEEEQVRDIASRASHLDPLVILSERMASFKSSPWPSEDAVHIVLSASVIDYEGIPARTNLNPQALQLLWQRVPSPTPAVRLQDAAMMLRCAQTAGACETSGRDLLLKMLPHELRKDPRDAFACLHRFGLFESSRVKVLLLNFVEDADVDVLQLLSRSLPHSSEPLPEEKVEKANRVVKKLQDRRPDIELQNLFRYLSEEVRRSIEVEELNRRLYFALLTGNSADEVWKNLSIDLSWAISLAESIRSSSDEESSQERTLLENGWSTLEQVLKAHTRFLLANRDFGVPALALAAVLAPHLTMGQIAAQIIALSPRYRADGVWWYELLRGLWPCERRRGWSNPDDCFEAGVNLVFQIASNLPDATERYIFEQAFREFWNDLRQTTLASSFWQTGDSNLDGDEYEIEVFAVNDPGTKASLTP